LAASGKRASARAESHAGASAEGLGARLAGATAGFMRETAGLGGVFALHAPLHSAKKASFAGAALARTA
jgi:hypothetical protein